MSFTVHTQPLRADFFSHGAPVPERVQSTTAVPQTRPLRRGWLRYDRGPPPDRPQPACSRLAAVGGARLRQHAALPCAQRATAGSARLRTTNALPSAVSMASAAAVMLAVPAGMSASASQAAIVVRDIRVRGRHPPRGPCAREGPVRTVAGEAKDSAPWPRIFLPTCSRQPRECDEALFTTTVKHRLRSARHVKRGARTARASTYPCCATAWRLPQRCRLAARASSPQPRAAARA